MREEKTWEGESKYFILLTGRWILLLAMSENVVASSLNRVDFAVVAVVTDQIDKVLTRHIRQTNTSKYSIV